MRRVTAHPHTVRGTPADFPLHYRRVVQPPPMDCVGSVWKTDTTHNSQHAPLLFGLSWYNVSDYGGLVSGRAVVHHIMQLTPQQQNSGAAHTCIQHVYMCVRTPFWLKAKMAAFLSHPTLSWAGSAKGASCDTWLCCLGEGGACPAPRLRSTCLPGDRQSAAGIRLPAP